MSKAPLNLAILRLQMDALGFFAEFSEEEKDFLGSQSDLFELFGKGETVIEEGDPERDFYVLLEGVLTVHKQGIAETIAELSPGAVFGEIAFFSRKRRTTSIRAQGRAVVLKIPEDHFRQLECSLQKTLMYKMVELLVGRLEKMNAVMMRVQELQMRAKEGNRRRPDPDPDPDAG